MIETAGRGAAGAALLVLSEVYYPGWRATVNGRAAEIRKTDGGLRGIEVPRGPSRVVLKYVPVSFYAGAALSALTVGGVLLVFIRHRRQGNAGGTSWALQPAGPPDGGVTPPQ